jgi:hypothetical protein
MEAVEEHLAMKRILADLLALDASFDAEVKVLKEEIEHHVKEEESDLFPKVKKILSAGDLDALEQEWSQSRKRSRPPATLGRRSLRVPGSPGISARMRRNQRPGRPYLVPASYRNRCPRHIGIGARVTPESVPGSDRNTQCPCVRHEKF